MMLQKDIDTFVLENRDKILYLKITRFEKVGFNSYEGTLFSYNLKVITKDVYKNKLIKDVIINTSYIEEKDDYLSDMEKVQDYLDCVLGV